MTETEIGKLSGLGGIILVAACCILVLFKLGDRLSRQQGTIIIGYPANLFSAVELTSKGPLAELASIQGRLVSIYRQLPQQSDLSIWLSAFLGELREIMDTAYRVSTITQIYGQPAQIDRLIEEVKEIEGQVVEQVAQRLLARDGDTQHELLDGRLATLRLCVRELANFSNLRQPA